MSYKITALIILVGSSIGLGGIILRKIPILSTLPKPSVSRKKKKGLILKSKSAIKKVNPFKDFVYELYLQKALRKIRILSLKTENKTFTWLQKLKENVQRKKIRENENYWQEIKKATKEDESG